MTYHKLCINTKVSNTMGGTAKCSSTRCTAKLVPSDSKQSGDRQSLVTVEKAKLAALKIH